MARVECDPAYAATARERLSAEAAEPAQRELFK